MHFAQKSVRKSVPKDPTASRARRNLSLVIAESALTGGVMSMSIITPFFYSIGLSNAQISLTQIIFTIVVIVFNLPTGYLADRLSRKWANIIGDFGHVALFLFYATVKNFWSIVIFESLIGIMSSLSNGVDQALIKHFSRQLATHTNQPAAEVLKLKTAKATAYRQICNLVLLLLGGPIGAISLRLALALSGTNYFIGGVISLFVQDDSEKLTPTHQNPLRDMWSIARSALADQPLRWRMFAHAVGREMTHCIIWIATPLLMQVGVPIASASLVWAANTLLAVVGAHLAAKYGSRPPDPQAFLVPLCLVGVSMLTLGFYLRPYTIWLYGLIGLSQGWTATLLPPMVQNCAREGERTAVSVLSLTRNLGY